MTKKMLYSFLPLMITFLMFACANENGNDEQQTEIATVDSGVIKTLKITGENIWIRESPTDGKVIMKLNASDECIILEKGKEETIKGQTDNWYKIKFKDKEGWVFGSQTSEAKKQEELDIKSVVNKIIDAVANNDFEVLNEFVNPEYGIYKFHNPGVFVAATYQENVDQDLLQFNFQGAKTDVKEEDAAEYDCDEGWDKEGIFLCDIEKFSELSHVISEEEFYINKKPSEAALNKAKSTENQFSKMLQFTEINAKIFLFEKEGKWFIGLIDLTTPCDA